MRALRLSCAALALACSADKSPGEGPVGAGGSGGGAMMKPGPGATPSAGGAPGAVIPEPPAPCAMPTAFSSPLRRLTRIEYNNTVRDLLGDPSSPADAFPPDEVSGGFSNNGAVLSVSPLLAEKYQDAAETLAANAVKNLATLVGCDPVRTGEEACARQFIERFGKRAYRRPLVPAELERLMAVYGAGRTGSTFARGIEVTLRAVLQSPHFLYRLEGATAGRPGEALVRISPHETATRLSYLLWSTMPDDGLFAAADRNELATPQQVGAMARLMLDDPRARKAVTTFYSQWLRLGALDTLNKDAAAYPDFTPQLREAMRAELPAFVEHLMWTGDRKLSTLLTAPVGFVTAPLARLYGVTAPAGAGPQRVMLNAAERAGVLTQAAVMAVHGLPNQSSPTHRGKFVREQVLCQELPPQPANLQVTAPEVDPRRPTRERFAQHAADPACAGCHALMDPLGFGFEAYDGIGRFRTMDGGRAVDTSGTLIQAGPQDGPFRGALELAGKLAASAIVQDCVATQWYRFAFGRLEGPGDDCSLRALRAAFAATGHDLRELLVYITQTEAFLHRPALAEEGSR